MPAGKKAPATRNRASRGAAAGARLRALLAATSDLILVLDSSGRFLEIPETKSSLLEMPAAEKIGRRIHDIFPADQAEFFLEKVHLALRERRAVHVEYALPIRGVETWFEANVSPVEADAVVWVARDITDRKKTEKALQESEKKYRELVETSQDLIWSVDDQGRFTFINKACRRTHGFEPSEMLGRPFTDFMPPEQVEKDMEVFREILAGKPSFQYETQHLRKDGSRVTLSFNAIVLRDAEGRVMGTTGTARDVTERRTAEDALRQSEARKGAIMMTALDGIVSMDHQGKILEFNPAAEKIFGRRGQEVTGRSMAELLIPERHRESHRRGMARYLESGESAIMGRRIEITAQRADGREFPVELTVTRIAASGPAVFTAFVRDLSETKGLEEQLRQSHKMEAVGKLAGGVAHDFNNLLTAILGYTNLLLDRLAADDPNRADVEVIRSAAERAASLTQQLLAFSRKQVLRPVLCDLNQIVSRAEAMLRPLLGEDVGLSTSLEPALSRILADPAQIEQVIVNLAVNARDAMPDGGRLAIRTTNLEVDEAFARRRPPLKTGRYVGLILTDTGVGMDPATQSRIFEPFFTTKEVGKGTGLGLSTVYGIIKQTGGYIFVESDTRKGTTFTICLPRAGEPAGETASPSEADAAPAPSGSETILLVEDEEIVRDAGRRLLAMGGYAVLTARGGEEALSVCRRHEGEIHLMVTDIVMPGMSGPDLAATALTLRPRMKVLYVSGYTDDHAVRHGVVENGSAFLQKPFTREALARRVREVLDAKG